MTKVPREKLFFDRIPREAKRDLSAPGLKLLCALCEIRKDNEAEIDKTDKQLAAVLGVHPNHLSRLYPELEGAGWIRRERRGRARAIVFLFDLKIGIRIESTTAREANLSPVAGASLDASTTNHMVEADQAQALGQTKRPGWDRPSAGAGNRRRKSLPDSGLQEPLESYREYKRENRESSPVPAHSRGGDSQGLGSSRLRSKTESDRSPERPPADSTAALVGSLLGRFQPPPPEDRVDEPPPSPPARPEAANVPEVPAPAPPVPPSKPTASTSDLTPSQARWLASLTPEKMVAWSSSSESRRSMMLDWFTHSVDPVMLAEAERLLVGKVHRLAQPAPETIPLTDLIRGMAGKHHHPELATIAARGLMIELNDTNQAWPWIEARCVEVLQNLRVPESLIEPLEKLRARQAKGIRIDAPGRYWTRSVNRWTDKKKPAVAPQQ